MRPNKALVWLLLGCFLVGEANSAPFGRLRARLRSREQQRANPPATAAAAPPESIQASSTGGAGPAGGASTPIGGYPAIITSPADEDVILFDDAIQAWINGPGGGGGGGITYDGTVGDGQIPVYDDTANEYIPTQAGAPVYSVKNPISWTPPAGGAARMVRAAGSSLPTTGTISAAGTSLTLGAATSYARGHCIGVRGAGADHGLSTPSAPVVIAVTQSPLAVLPNGNETEAAVTWTVDTGTDVVTFSTALAISTGQGVIVSNAAGGANQLPTVSATPLTEMSTTYYVRVATSTTGTLHPTALDATNNTNTLNFDGAGTGTHYISVVGAATNAYQISALSGNGGETEASSATTITTAPSTLDNATHNFVAWALTSGANGYSVHGDGSSNRYRLAGVNDASPCIAVTADAAGYTAPEIGDIGRTFVQGSHDGRILAIDFTNRIFYILPTATSDTFPGGAAVSWTITSGAGAGTQTSAGVTHCYWRDRGAAMVATPYKRAIRRSSAFAFKGEIILHPASSSGVFYEVIDTTGDECFASSAPSYDTDLGDVTVDGNVRLRRVIPAYSPTPPAAEVLDTLWTTITDLSGTTATVADAATTSVTTQTVWHDDLPPCQAWWEVCLASPDSGTLYFPGGKDTDYTWLTGIINGTGRDERWGTATGGGSSQFALFNWYDSSTKIVEREWVCDAGVTVSWRPLDWMDGTENTMMWRLGRSAPKMRGGWFVCSMFGEHMRQVGDEQECHWYAWNSSIATPHVSGPVMTDAGFSGWPKIGTDAGDRSYGTGIRATRCRYYAGGCDNDGTFLIRGGVFDSCQYTGIGFTRSVVLYQTNQTLTEPLIIRGGKWKNARKTGFRFRQNDGLITGGAIIEDCSQIMCEDDPVRLTVEDARIVRTNIVPTGCNDVKLSRLTLEDSPITVASGNDNFTVSDVYSYTPSGGTSLATGSSYALLSVTGGTNLKVANSNFESLHGTGSPDVKGFQISGGSDEIDLVNSTFRGSRQLGVRWTSFTGRIRSTGCFFGGTAGPEAVQISMGSTAVYTSVNDTFDGSPTSNEIAFNGGGRAEFTNPTFTGKLSVEASITGPFIIRGGNSSSSTAAAIVEPSVVIESHNFAVAPTLTGATLYTKGNSVADSKSASPTAIAATANNYAAPVTDVVVFTLTGNQSMTGVAAWAPGTQKLFVNGDGADTLTLEHADAGSSAGNQFFGSGSADVVLGPGEAAMITQANGYLFAREQ
jgi:hypothetical protein